MTGASRSSTRVPSPARGAHGGLPCPSTPRTERRVVEGGLRMSKASSWLVGSLCACLFACGGGGNGSADGGVRHGGDGDAGIDGGAPHEDPQTDDPHAACDHYIDCAREATPTSVTPLIATYGAEGSCWTLPSVKPEDCAAECAAARKVLLAANPSEACGDCTKDSECGEGICVDFACTTIGQCTCRPEYPDCDYGELSPVDCGDGLCAGEACSESSECSSEQKLVCASYKGAPKSCMEVCTDSDACSAFDEECSEERDAMGRGLCVPKKCKSHVECGGNRACNPDGTCGCRDEGGCLPEQECKR